MKKIIHILLVNIIVFFTILFIFNSCFEKILNFFSNRSVFPNKVFRMNVEIDNIPVEKNTVEYVDFNDKTFNEYCGEQRIEFDGTSNQNPIVVLGCSYAYGHGLKKEQSFPYNLQKETGRSIYNYGQCGSNIIYSTEYFLNDAKNSEKTTNSEYIIYLYMYDHVNRLIHTNILYQYYEDLFPVSDNKFHKFLLHNVNLYKWVCIALHLNTLIKELPNTENFQKLLKIIVLTAYQKIKLHSPNAKFIIIIYNEKFSDGHSPFEIYYNYSFINSKIWDKLESETNGDIRIVRTKDIMGFSFDAKYKLEKDIDGWHPNARVWKEFTPKFASQYIK